MSLKIDLAKGSSFFSSLRSDSAPEQLTKRRSLSVSSWYTPPRNDDRPRFMQPKKSDLAISLSDLQQHLEPQSFPVEQHVDHYHPATLSPTPSHHQLSPPKIRHLPLSPSNRRNQLWEPPISCQKRVLPFSSYPTFFCLELTNRDYYERLVATVVLSIEAISFEFLRSRASAGSNLQFSEAMEEFINLLIANSSTKRAGSYTQKMQILYNINDMTRTHLSKAAEVFLSTKEEFTLHKSGWDSCRLGGLDPVFDATHTLIQLMREYSRNESMTNNYERLLRELKELFNQYRLHAMSQVQRMTALGWQWSPDDETHHSHANNIGNVSSMDEIRSRWEAIKSPVSNLLTPANTARLMLTTRLHHIAHDLMQMSKQSSESSDYNEGRRLRELSEIINDHTLDNDSLARYDQAQSEMMNMRHLLTDLQTVMGSKRANNNQDLESLESIMMDLNSLMKRLNAALQPVHLLDQVAMERVMQQGTSVINADFILKQQEGPSQGVSLASLLIKADSLELVEAVKKWPGITMLRNPLTQSQQIQLQMEAQDEDEDEDEAVTSSIGGYSTSFNNTGNTNRSMFRAGSSRSKKVVRANTTSNTNNRSSRNSSDGPQLNDFLHSSPVTAVNHSSNNNEQKNQFAQFVSETLHSFASLQYQLDSLLTPSACAHTELLTRLVGMRLNLHSLLEVSAALGQAKERERLMNLMHAIDETIDVDESEPALPLSSMTFHASPLHSANPSGTLSPEQHDNSNEIGRGRRRLDNIWQLCDHVMQSIDELQKLKQRARSLTDFTAAAAIDSMAQKLSQRLQKVQHTVTPFNLLDAENDDNTVLVSDLNERIAREGTEFFTADFLFTFSCGSKGHTVGSLAIVAGTGAMLRFIKATWPGLTALGNGQMDNTNNNNNNSGIINSELDSDDQSHHKISNNQATSGRFAVQRRKSNRFSVSMAAASMAATAASMVDFRDANALRLLGFDPRTLKGAGFSDIDILTAGYSVDQLREAGFDADAINTAVGVLPSAQLLQSLGFGLEQQVATLVELFKDTNGVKWTQQKNWISLVDDLQTASSTKLESGTRLQQQSRLLQRLTALFGVEIDSQSQEVERLLLGKNNLVGTIPSGLSALISLKSLVLSDNKLKGAIPSALGLLVNLEILSLDHNELEGEIPKTFKNLQSLSVLSLGHNKLTGTLPTTLATLTRLRRLDVSHNHLSGPLPQRLGAALGCLQECLLQLNQFTGDFPVAWTTLTQLTHLDVQGNNLTGPLPTPDQMQKLSKLTCLNLRDNKGLTYDRLQLQRALPKCRIIL